MLIHGGTGRCASPGASVVDHRQHRAGVVHRGPPDAVPLFVGADVVVEEVGHETAGGGAQRPEVARLGVGGGELVLFPQGRMWNNETYGTMRDEPYNATARGAFALQMALLEWLAGRPRVLAPETADG